MEWRSFNTSPLKRTKVETFESYTPYTIPTINRFRVSDDVSRSGGRNRSYNGLFYRSNNLLLTEREGRTGGYWPEVVAVRTERSEVRTKTTEGQYSLYGPEQVKLVSSLLYGIIFSTQQHFQ